MRIPRLPSILGPAAVVYVLAARAWIGISSSYEGLVAVLSISLSLTPFLLLTTSPTRGTSRLAWMGASLALAVASAGAPSKAIAWTHGVAWLSTAMVMFDLAVPRSLKSGVRYAILVCFAGGVFVVVAFFRGELPPDVALAVVAVAVIIATGAVHQITLAQRGHALEGALSGIALAGLGVALACAWFGPFDGVSRVGIEFSVAALLWLGHAALVDPHWRALRRVGVPFLVACAVSFVAGSVVATRLTDDPLPLGVAASGFGVLWWVAFTATNRVAKRVLSRTSGRLVEGVNAARHDLPAGAELEQIASGSLDALAEAFREIEGDPELFTVQPPLRIRLDAGKRPNIRSAEAPRAIVEAVFVGGESEVLDISNLKGRVVREPAIRELVNAMEGAGIGAVLPCAHLDHVEGLLLLPIGDRTEPLSRTELGALVRLGEALGGALSSALAHRRAQSHIHELSALRRDAEDRVVELEGELDQLRGQFDVLGRGLAEDQTLHVAYSPSMRSVQIRAIELAPNTDPVLLIARAGAPVLPVSRFIHDRGPRWEAPFVVADCSLASEDLVITSLFGSEEAQRRGWFQSADGGTLLLRDLPALPPSAQARLAAAVSEGAGFADVRVIATARTPLEQLQRRGAIDSALVDLFSRTHLVIPSLRERREDVPSLVLLAIDRACRVLACEPVGIEQAAMTALTAHDWPGDVAELEFMVELAVSRTRARSIRLADFPGLARPEEQQADPLAGTYEEVERRLLQRALVSAGGNKSEAARMLGLKRTTFLDKLRRHELEREPLGRMAGSSMG